MDHSDLGHEAKIQAELLDKINKKLAELGSTAQWQVLPKDFPEYAALKGQKLLMLDNQPEPIENFIPHLMVATAGNAEFIRQQQQSKELLVQEILAAAPDIVLVDYNLNSLKGADLVKALRSLFKGKIFGFSSDRLNSQVFIEAGADGNIEKLSWDQENSVRALGKLLSR